MRRRVISLSVFLLLFTSVMSVSAATEQKKTSVNYKVDPEYEIMIPVNTDIPYQATETSYGTIQVKQAVLDPGKCIRVTLDSDGVLKNQEHAGAEIPYEILAGDSIFTSQTYTKAGEETELTVSIHPEDWKKARGGAYRTTVTFTVSYEDIQ